MKRLMLTVAAACACAAFAGRTCHWTGAEDSRWANPKNWLGEEVPGVLWDGVTGEPGYPTGDTAVFGPSPFATIDCTGLYSIGTVKITGADAPAYVFTNGSALDPDGWGALPIEPVPNSGTDIGIVIDASVTKDQTLGVVALANLVNSGTGEAEAHPECLGDTFRIRNDAAVAVIFSRFDCVRRRPGQNDKWQNLNLYFMGIGRYEFRETMKSHGGTYPLLGLASPGPFDVKCDLPKMRKIQLSGSPSKSTLLRIAEGCCVSFDTRINSPGISIYGKYDLTIEGQGTLRFSEHREAVSWDRMSDFTLTDTARLTIACPVTCLSHSPDYTTPSLHLVNGSGTFVCASSANTIPGSIDMGSTWDGVFSFPSVANLGTITGFSFGSSKNGARVESTSAASETFGKNLIYTNSVRSVVANAGYGTLTVASAVSADEVGAGAVAEFAGERGTIVFSPAFAGAAVPGTFRFSGRKGVVLPASTVLPAGVAKVQLADETSLTVEGAGVRALPELENVSGGNRVYIPAGVDLTLANVAVTAGTLDLVTESRTSTITVTGFSGVSPAGLLFNGLPAAIGADGRLVAQNTPVDRTIAARGDAVPNAPSEAIGITAAGEGANTGLAADATEVAALVHQHAGPAVIEVGAGQTLTAGKVVLDYGAGDLTIGSQVGRGALNAAILHNSDVDRTLSVNANVQPMSITASGKGRKLIRRTGGAATVGTLSVAEGTTTLDGGRYETTDESVVAITNGARLVLGNGAILTAPGGVIPGSEIGINLAQQGEGVLQVEDGAAVTNQIVVGNGTKGGLAVGAVYLRGGSMNPCAVVNDNRCNTIFRKFAHTYYGISGGELSFNDNVHLGDADGYANGVITQTGGLVLHRRGKGSFRYAQGYYVNADWYLCGGSFCAESGINLGDWGSYHNYMAVITVDGDATYSVTGTVQAAYRNDYVQRKNIRGLININGNGVFAAGSINRNDYSYPAPGLRADDKIYVNFNGGTFRALGGNAIFGSIANTSHIDRVTVYENGARIDANGMQPYLSVPIESPEGLGVASVDWSDALHGHRMVAAPFVKIIGSGEGASAHALLDEEAGRVTNIVVTSRGWGYGPDTYAAVYYGYGSNPIQVPVTLAESGSGDVRFVGAGRTSVDAENTYTGATVIGDGGTVRLIRSGAFNPATRLVLEETGKLDLNGQTQTFADIETRGGAVEGGTLLVSGLVADFAAAKSGRPKDLDLSVFAFTPQAKVSLENFSADELEPNRGYTLARFSGLDGVPPLDVEEAQGRLPKGWSLRLNDRSLRLVPEKGLAVVIR